MVDLGEWFSGGFVIPGEVLPPGHDPDTNS